MPDLHIPDRVAELMASLARETREVSNNVPIG